MTGRTIDRGEATEGPTSAPVDSRASTGGTRGITNEIQIVVTTIDVQIIVRANTVNTVEDLIAVAVVPFMVGNLGNTGVTRGSTAGHIAMVGLPKLDKTVDSTTTTERVSPLFVLRMYLGAPIEKGTRVASSNTPGRSLARTRLHAE
jgi:hypothetical protein